MDFRFTPPQEELRQRVQGFLEGERRRGSFQPGLDGPQHGFSPDFSRRLAQQGWIGVNWPRQYGGQEMGHIERMVITEELMRCGAPVMFHWLGDRQIGPCILAFGTEEQRREFLPRIARAEICFCFGLSEPGAGSDAASVQTRAIAQGDGFIVQGQKTWTSYAHKADYCYLVARTNPSAPKHRGLSVFIVDMKLPGITVRPIIDMSGRHVVNDVFLDSVPLPASALAGDADRGWYEAASQLDYERSGIERLMGNYPLMAGLIELVKQTPSLARRPEVRRRLADLQVSFEVGRWLIYRVAWILDRERVPNYESAMGKAFGTEFMRLLADTAVEVLGLGGQLMPGSPGAPLEGWAADNALWSRLYTIGGGTSEIMRNIIALRGLGLPRG